MEQYLRVGVVTTTHGVRGEMKVYPTTDDPKRFLKLDHVILQHGKERTQHDIESVKFFKNLVILKLSGINSMDEAALMRQAELYISREDAVPLEEGEYYIADLIGMKVISDEGEDLGIVRDVIETGANDVYEVTRKKGKPLLLPAIPECVLDIDIEESVMKVHIMEGLLDL